MREERRRVLEMLAQGKVSVDEAERLMQALGQARVGTATPVMEPGGVKRMPRYLMVRVDDPDDNTHVNIRVPLQLLRAGVKLGALLPKEAQQHLDDAMDKHGFRFDLNALTPETLDDFIEALGELEMNVDSGDGTVVRLYCE